MLSRCVDRFLQLFSSVVFFVFVPAGLPSGPVPPTQEVHPRREAGGVHCLHGNLGGGGGDRRLFATDS